MARIDVDRERLAEFCRKHHIRKLAFFGSVLRDDFRPDSDIDVLVEFEPGQPVGYFELVAMEDELSVLLGARKVDLRTPLELSRYFRGQVAASAEVQYAGG
jgi:predicted nucleotidyltransferase